MLENLFSGCGLNLEDWLKLYPVEPGCYYQWPDGKDFYAPGNLDGFEEAIREHFPAELDAFVRFRRYIRNLWEVSNKFFLFTPLNGKTLGRIRPGDIPPALSMLRPGSMYRVLCSFFKDPRLIQLFSRFATYNGSNPFQTPSAFNVIAHAELAFGAWGCHGGMAAIPQALATAALQQGAEIRYGQTVEGLSFDSSDRFKGVRLKEGPEIRAGSVVINADAVSVISEGWLPDRWKERWRRSRLQRSEPSSSGFSLLLAVEGEYSRLAHHNVFFSSDYPLEFNQLFDHPQPLSHPTLYLSRPSAYHPTMAPAGNEAWFVLVNAPALKNFREWNEDQYANQLIQLIENRLPEFCSARIIKCFPFSPKHWESRFNAWYGSLYGQSSNPLLSAFLRIPNNARFPGVAFCGGSCHPGGGVPLVVSSGVLALQSLGITTPVLNRGI